jgi:hypothetical protein
VNLAKSWLGYVEEYLLFRRMTGTQKGARKAEFRDLYPRLTDRTSDHSFPRIYVYHASWAARVVAKIKPKKHIDISSTIWFSSLVSAFVPVEFYDYRPADLHLSNLKSADADLTNLKFKTNSVFSISCMHTIEHIGLGRYGDPIDPDGDIKAINELKRVTAVNGNLLIVLPVGEPKVMFNAHRIYSYKQILNYFNGFELVEFALIKEHNGNLRIDANPNDIEKVTKLNGDCGCFWFRKIQRD